MSDAFFKKGRSLRFGEDDRWYHEAGRYIVEGQNPSEGTAPFFFYIQRRNRSNTEITLRCKSYKATRCPVAPKIKISGEIIGLFGVHNHLPDREGYGVEFRQARTDWIDDTRLNPRKDPVERKCNTVKASKTSSRDRKNPPN